MPAAAFEIFQLAPRFTTDCELVPVARSFETSGERIERLPVESATCCLHVGKRNCSATGERGVGLSQARSAMNVAGGETKTFANLLGITKFLGATGAQPMMLSQISVGNINGDCERTAHAFAAHATLFPQHHAAGPLVRRQARNLTRFLRRQIEVGYRKRVQRRCQWSHYLPALVIRFGWTTNFKQSTAKRARHT